MNNLDQLIQLMFDHSLDRRDVVRLLNKKRGTVDSWFFTPDSQGYRAVSGDMVELLRLKLKEWHLSLYNK